MDRPEPRIVEGGAVIVALLVTIAGLLAAILWLMWPRAEYDPGGSVAAYAARAVHYTGPLPMSCASACTLYLLNGCVTPDHRLIFHLPSVDTPHLRAVMASHYPPPIAAWFMSLPEGATEMTITGAEAIRHQATAC